MKTTTLTYTVRVTYESEEDLDDADRADLCDELRSTLHNANTNGELDSHIHAIEAFTLEVGISDMEKPDA